MNKNGHYIGTVPLWLVELLNQARVPLKTAVDFEELSTILSVDDVSYYVHYLMKVDSYTDSMFSDMDNITELPKNRNWITANSEAIEKAGKEFHKLYNKHQSNLVSDDVPELIRKCSYNPVGIERNILLLVAVGSYGGQPNFTYDCVKELDKQILFDTYRSFQIFKFYTMAD